MSIAPFEGVRDAYLYTRVSTDEQGDDGLSLDNQEARGLAYINQKGWTHRGTHTDVMSGRRDDREGYQAVLREVRSAVVAGRRPVLVVNMLDRLGRRLAERARVWDEFEKLGVPIHVVEKNGEVDHLVYNVWAVVAEEESRTTAKRVRQVRERLRELGWKEPGRAPWGYRWRPATDEERRNGAPKTVLEVHPDEAPYVREAWQRLARGESLCEIARWAAALPSVARGDRNLNFGVIRTTFRAPVYVARNGDRFQADDVLERPRTRWEPLVSDDDWLRVRANVDKEKRKLPAQASGRYLLTGFLRCDRCGSRMAGSIIHTKRKKSGICRQYACTGGRTKGARMAGTCRSHSVSADCLDEVVLRTVGELLTIANDPRVLDAAKAAWDDEARRYAADPDVERIQTLDRGIVKTRERMHRNHTLYVDGDIAKDAYLASQSQYQHDLDALEAERARCTGRATAATVPSFYAVLEQVKGWHRAVEAAGEYDPQAVRAALAELLESVTPVPTEKFGKYEAAFVWTATGKALLRTAFRFGASENVLHVERFGTTKRWTYRTSTAA